MSIEPGQSSEQRSCLTSPFRVAVYLAPPPDSLIARAAEKWLGRNCYRSGENGVCDVPGITAERLEQLLHGPRHYGFHATLKPPFRLRDGFTVDHVLAHLSTSIDRFKPFTLPQLRVAMLQDFICLRPAAHCFAINAMAAAIVETLDHFRQPPGEEEIIRRRRAGLSERQHQLLLRWGYPYVFDEFRFHFSLTGPIPDPVEQVLVLGFLRRHFRESLQKPVVTTHVSLFIEPAGQPLVEINSIKLGGHR